VRLALILLVISCGGRAPPPTPVELDPAGLARLLDEDFARLGDIAHRLRGKCTETVTELRLHVARMKQHRSEVDRMLRDTRQTTELKKQLAAYSDRATGKDQIADDLGATYLACGAQCAPETPCKDRYELERAIAGMPTY
jgi:hypothetical protein